MMRHKNLIYPIPVEELENKLLNIQGIIVEDNTSVYEQVKHEAYSGRICLRKIGQLKYELSENFGYKGILEAIIVCCLRAKKTNSSEFDIHVLNSNKVDAIAIWTAFLSIMIIAVLSMVSAFDLSIGFSLTIEICAYIGGGALFLYLYRYLMAQLFIRQIIKGLDE